MEISQIHNDDILGLLAVMVTLQDVSSKIGEISDELHRLYAATMSRIDFDTEDAERIQDNFTWCLEQFDTLVEDSVIRHALPFLQLEGIVYDWQSHVSENHDADFETLWDYITRNITLLAWLESLPVKG